MRVLVLGCGGIGGTLAATLTRAGVDVQPVTGNAAIAARLAAHGYEVQDFEGPSWTVPVARAPLVELPPAPASLDDRFDLCIVATQNTTLERALASARPHLAHGAAVVCCQNGLPEERAATVVGRERVLGCVVGWGASMVEPGRYQRTSKGTLAFGRPFAESPEVERIATLCEAASPTKIVDDLAAVRWSKLAINSVTTTLGALGGDRLGPLLGHRFGRRLALEVFTEVYHVARAESVRPSPLAGTLDIGKIALTPDEQRQSIGSPQLAYKHSILLAVGFKYRRMRSSMLYAIERGRPPEIGFLNGEVVRRGEARGVAVPVNRAAVEMVARIVAGERRPSLETLREVYDQTVGAPAKVARAA